jgi:4-carboxymuconolactone decarboxylase
MTKSRMPVERVGASDDPEVAATFAKLAAGKVGVVNIHRILANSPVVFAQFIGLAHALRFETELDPAERELAILRVLEIHGGDYELSHHRPMGKAAGLSDAQIAGAAAKDAPADLYSERERVILLFADCFAAGKGIEAEALDKIEPHLDNRQRVELAMTLALYTGLAYFTNMLEVPQD